MRPRVWTPLLAAGLAIAPLARPLPAQAGGDEPAATGSVIFFHPDGMGLNHWTALRLLLAGPDGRLNWDRLPAMAVYKGHVTDALTATSNAAATVHAYGVKVPASSYGKNGTETLVARSGREASLMREAQEAGRAVGLVNSGSITEPGTGAFVAQVDQRLNHLEIARQILEARPDVVLGGGERYFLPRGTQGAHGEGVRTDGRDLVAEARAAGYRVVYTRDELLALPDTAARVLGLVAAGHTFNARSEESLRERGLEPYEASAPSVGEMLRAAVSILSRSPRGFFLVVEEEGTDNFGNANNAAGTLEAGRRADEAIGVALDYLSENPATLFLTTSDSDAGGMQAIGPPPGPLLQPGHPAPARDLNRAPLDGAGGTATEPFLSAPDRAGRRWPFVVAWATRHDASGGIVARAAGLNSGRLSGTLDSTEMYAVMYRTLFGRSPD